MIDERIKRRIFIIGVIFVLLTALPAITLFRKQADFQGYNKKILHQSVRKIRIPARRGRIYTSDYKVIADNQITFDLLLYIHEIRAAGRDATVIKVENAIEEMAQLLGRENTFSRKDILRHLNWYPGLPLKVFSDLNEKERGIVNDLLSDLQGWAMEIDAKRIYPYKNFASHLIGYTRKSDPASASDRREFSYYISDYEGKAGLEKVFDTINMKDFPTLRGLRGKPGYSLVQVNNLGYVHHSLVEEIAPLHGNHLILNLDFEAQKKAQSILQEDKGALVLVDADNGDILAMASNPNYDLSRFSPKLEEKYYQKLLKDSRRPLVPKAISGTYSPGSVLKVLTALAALENGMTPQTIINCDGYTEIGNTKIHCTSYWYGGHRDTDLFTALEKSCNDYFIEAGIKLGRTKLCSFMQDAGFGKAPQLELPCAAGILPTVENKKKIYRSSRWTPFDTALISIGQGMITVSPLQIALYCAAIANGGRVYRPHLVNSVVDQQGNTLFKRQINVDFEIKAAPEHFDAVRQGMFQVVNSPTGSGRKGRVNGFEIYGKTGTAEVGSAKNRRKNTWFMAFVRHAGKTYAAAMVIEDGESGGATCAPLMAEFLEDYLSRLK